MSTHHTSDSGDPHIRDAPGTAETDEDISTFVAVVGMAGRFPGAGDVDAFWDGLVRGEDTITRTAAAPGIGGRAASAYGAVDGGDLFDAAFFGYAPREALLLDPQHRVFMECAWEALEHAGCDPARFPGPVGVFGGSGDTGHFATLLANRASFPGVNEWQLRLASGADFLTSRVAYKLGLTGPAVTVQTACSTSLVAVHTALQSLLAGECDLALAGGVTLRVPHPVAEDLGDGLLADDGYCRAFDAAATGTVSSDGAGVVVLKRLEDALRGGDHVHAVLRGSAVTNDGAAKAGFTAPSVDGQSTAVTAAHLVAGTTPADIGYLEAHGTGTPVGDPIEVRALTKAYGDRPGAPGSCVLGSVKSNIGHTDAASGVIGLIKAALALREQLIPGTAHFTTPNPDLDLPATPFRISSANEPWPRGAAPRLAAVNSLGIGGTNAHVVLAEAPPAPPHRPGRPYQILPLSARTPSALKAAAGRLADALRDPGAAPLDDAAWTLQTGRAALAHRGFTVALDRAGAARDLTSGDQEGFRTGTGPDQPRPVAFLFPGQGGQHLGMARELHEHEPVFRETLDECAELAAPLLGTDLRRVLYAPDTAREAAAAQLATMRVSQVAVFAVQAALTELWGSWGVHPDIVLGHSLGAYAAATAAGVLDLPDALRLVLTRSRILDELPDGSMLAVPLPADTLAPMLPPPVSIAAINGPQQCVVTGTAADIAALHARLTGEGVESRPLHINAAAHSVLVEPAMADFERSVAGVTLRPPTTRWISDRTGSLVTREQACDPSYWSGHLRHTVRFDEALRTLFASGDHLLLEVGPGRTLTTLARRHPACGPTRPTAWSLPHAIDATGSGTSMMHALGRVWLEGADIDWEQVHSGEQRRRTPLPTYPFERQRFRLAAPAPASLAPADEGTTAPRQPATAVEFARPDLGEKYEPAIGRVEEALAAAFGQVLGVDQVGRHDNFFDYGGDSLVAAQYCKLAGVELGAELSVRMVFRAPTVARLAEVLADATAGTPPQTTQPHAQTPPSTPKR
ncbi:type I polyketide synthase [Streptomyces montanisoli]|uniref:Acyltransferase domain-containing protein n=1 Tax=Streptomyces montanisoli TaxID=2798581 RepID=A0A940MD45_9ACTN|nr:type I polyketide synthase [Streptomyces montanisoli]MBP0456871.1 acyltransferase domain-containing protein [Streptomyces montanisoli]